MDATTVLKLLVEREADLAKRRTRALATQQWAKVIDIEARIAECEQLRMTILGKANEEYITPVAVS